jgi:hypothetical protein
MTVYSTNKEKDHESLQEDIKNQEAFTNDWGMFFNAKNVTTKNNQHFTGN